MTTFAELLTKQSAAYVLLAEVQPLEVLGSWTAAGGGLSNTYYCSFSTQIATSVVPGGLYRRLDAVKQNSTSLTSRASAALVDANLGSYFHDTANSRIYVSTTTGAAPDTFPLIGAWFTLFFSTSSVNFADQPLYAPLITGTLPTLSSEMPDPLFGATISEAGTLELLNGDGLFDRLSKQYVWRNKSVTIKLGGTELAYSEFATVTTLRINSMSVDDEVATLQLEAVGSLLNRNVPTRTFGATYFFNDVGQGVLGRVRPWLLGVARDCPLPLVDVSSNGAYMTADIIVGFAPTVDAVYAINRATKERTTLTVTTDYTVFGNALTIVNATYHFDTYDIWADLTWADGSATAGNILFIFLLNYLGESATNFASIFNDANLNTQVLGVYLDESVSAKDVVRVIEQSELAQLYPGVDGKWVFRSMIPDIPASYVSLSDADFVQWDTEPSFQNVLATMRVDYDYRAGSQSAAQSESAGLEQQYRNETTDAHQLLTYIVQDFDADALAEHLRYFRSRPGTLIRFEERGLSLMQAHVGDLVSVTRERAPLARTGSYDGHFLRLVRLEKSLGPVPTVRGVFSDLDGQVDAIFRCADAAVDLNWAAATDQQRAWYGFCADTSGYIDAIDPLTRHLKVAY